MCQTSLRPLSPELHLAIRDEAFAVVSSAWRLHVTIVFLQLWRLRNASVHDTAPPTDSHLFAIDGNFIRRLGSARAAAAMTHPPSLAFQARAHLLRAVHAWHTRDATTLLAPGPIWTACHHVLLFDGGSRGNPGPGGAGAAIGVVDPRQGFRLLWACAIHLPDPTTNNNVAEFTGVVVGLRRLLQLKPSRCTVIGDSEIILRLLRRHRSPRRRLLRLPFLHARRMADQLPIQGWRHHYRAFNTAADAAANWAMDNCRSSLLFPPPGDSSAQTAACATRLTTLITADVQPWLADLVDWRPP